MKEGQELKLISTEGAKLSEVRWPKATCTKAVTMSNGTFRVQPSRGAKPQVSENGPAKNN